MMVISDVRGLRGEDAPQPQAATARAGRGPGSPQVSEWQEGHQAQLEALIAHMGYRVGFTKDERTGRVVCRVMDQEGEVIRQIPPEEMLELAAKMDEVAGLIFDRVL
jgi:flagellar protein FlaG